MLWQGAIMSSSGFGWVPKRPRARCAKVLATAHFREERYFGLLPRDSGELFRGIQRHGNSFFSMNGRALGLLAFGDGDDHERSFLGGEVLQNELVIAPRCFIEIARIFVIP